MRAFRMMFIATALALLAVCANAADTAKPHGYATRDELRECMDLEAALKARFHGLEAANTANDKTGDRLAADSAKVHETLAKLDRNDPAAVAAFKQQMADYNANVVAWKAATAEAQKANDAYTADSATVDQKCLSLAYRAQDMDAVLKERKKAAAASSATP